MADVTYEIDSDGVAVVTWDLENRSMNVLNFQSLGEYRSIIEKLISDESVKGIVLRSAKDAFIAGADLTSSEVFGFDSVQEDKVKAAEKIYNGNMDMWMAENQFNHGTKKVLGFREAFLILQKVQ